MDHPQGACLWHSHELTVLVLQPRILTIAMAADRADLVRRVLFASGAQAIEHEPPVLPGVCMRTYNLGGTVQPCKGVEHVVPDL